MNTDKTICINSKVNGKQPSTSARIYDVGGVSMAITCSFLPSIAEPISVAMRGRNPHNPSERGKSNGQYQQRLEMNKSGVANTITSVQKDSMVAEPQVIGNIYPSQGQNGNIYSCDGVSPTINAGIGVKGRGIGSCNAPKITEPQVLTPKRTEFGKAVRKQYESHEIEMSRHDMTTMEPRTDGITNTLTSVQKDNYLAIPEATAKGYAEAYEGDSVNLAVPNSQTRRGRVGNQMANTLDTGCQQGVVEAEEEQSQVKYRIRKLTPREVFRLQGVDDADIDKLLSAGISNSQLYKCAGNSITVDVLYHIFRKAWIDTGCESQQPTLF